MRVDSTPRGVMPSDVLCVLVALAYAALSVSLIPFDFQDLCYLFSLEQGRWVMQEWVHPIYVPLLDLLRSGLALVGYKGPMLVPVELMNVAAAIVAFALLYRMARRFPGSALPAVVALTAAAFSYGFWHATVRPTPYALAFLALVVALMLLIDAGPVTRTRYALSGAIAGVAMGLHASAMALGVVGIVCAWFERDCTPREKGVRLACFAGAMLAVAVASWTVFVRYRAIGLEFFRSQDFRSMFLGIEQMRGSSIYTSSGVVEQVATFIETLRFQGGGLLRAAVVVGLVLLVQRWRAATPWPPLERRLLLVTGANFAAIAAFFLINNTHNGFIFASLALVPVMLAVAVRDSRVLLALLLLTAMPDAVSNIAAMRSGPVGPNEPLFKETRYLQQWLGRRDVLITPGTPFPEVLYWAHLNIFELSDAGASHASAEVPVVHAGPELRARVAWWRAHGGRVFFALGDESVDFTGDASGATKERQVFWRPELHARDRARRLAELRARLSDAGIALGDPISSPTGQRYAELVTDAAVPPPPAPEPASMNPQDLRTLYRADRDVAAAYHAQRALYLTQLADNLPDDPWHSCDVMQLICQTRPRRAGQDVPCEQTPRCTDLSGAEARADAARSAGLDDNRGCFWGTLSNEAEERSVTAYLSAWADQRKLGRLADWGFSANQQTAEMNLVLPAGEVKLRWQLSGSCAPGPVTMTSPAPGIDPVPQDALQQLVASLPIPKVRPGAKPGR